MFLRIVAGGLLLIGLWMAGFGVYFIALGYEAEGWRETEGRVVSVAIRVDTEVQHSSPVRSRREALRRYYPSVRYEWTVDGETYSGSRYRLGETHEKYDEREEAAAAGSAFRPDGPVTVYYDKDAPGEAVLDPSLSAGVFVPLPLGLVFLALGAVLLRNREAIERNMQAQASRSAKGRGGSP